MAERSLAKRVWYRFLQSVLRLLSVTLLRLRCQGQQLVPATGGALVLSNHQSHLDPILVGVSCSRRLNYLARKSLFTFKPLGWLIDSLDAISIDRDGSGISGLKETLKRLRRGEMVLIFPEGTRTADGEVAPLKPGFCALAKRAGVPLLPVGIEGAFAAWPRTRSYPRPGKVRVVFGPPMLPELFADWDDRQVLEEVERRIRACHAAARASLGGPKNQPMVTVPAESPAETPRELPA